MVMKLPKPSRAGTGAPFKQSMSVGMQEYGAACTVQPASQGLKFFLCPTWVRWRRPRESGGLLMPVLMSFSFPLSHVYCVQGCRGRLWIGERGCHGRCRRTASHKLLGCRMQAPGHLLGELRLLEGCFKEVVNNRVHSSGGWGSVLGLRSPPVLP